jgi:hypothetical protein
MVIHVYLLRGVSREGARKYKGQGEKFRMLVSVFLLLAYTSHSYIEKLFEFTHYKD